ncbi:hypothetical protein A1351_11365 [Methylosinus sp. R-45379]|uniref:baseplate hub protein n=1 Tax=Methylosinus sp. R-45379 TaxID=980563 RepID=UPI0007C8F090|nr:hypothetical protein [Methylosinus sp. R-45379]OAI28695.1 hypothetical protein A1351_11365 [Methylosinus sp. R-45379]
MAFTEKQLRVTFNLSDGSSKTIAGKRIVAKVSNAGAPSQGQLDCVIFGLRLSDMNQMSTVGTQWGVFNQNKVTLEGGDASRMNLIFKGTIGIAFVDANAQPEVCFRFNAVAAGYESVSPIDPTSNETDTDVVQTLQQIATKAGLGFENNGVNIKIGPQYLAGSALEQIRVLCDAAGIMWIIENNSLAIWNPGQARKGAAVLISPQTGMIGYPAFSTNSIIVRTQFNPQLKFGCQIEVKSDLTPATGTWNTFYVAHDLSAQLPGGPWLSEIRATPASPGAPVLAQIP